MTDAKPLTDRDRELDDLRAVLELPQGRRVLWRYMAIAGVFKNPHAGDPHQTSFYCGQQSMGQTILVDVTEARDESLLLMMRENQAALADRKRIDEQRAKESPED